MSAKPQPSRSGAAAATAAALEQEIGRLQALDLDQLRVQFRNRTGRIAPMRLSRFLLLRLLAYRIQAEVLGDLRPETRRLLDRLAKSDGASVRQSASTCKASNAPAPSRPRRGTVLAREWQGRMEHVMVLDEGFAWNGSSYASLSAVASAMTGTKWNGRRFFGLDRNAGAVQARISS